MMDLEVLRGALVDEKVKPPRTMYIIVKRGSGVYYGCEGWTENEDEALRFPGDGDLPEEIDGGAAYRGSYRQPDGPRGLKIWTYTDHRESARCKTSNEKVYAESKIIETCVY